MSISVLTKSPHPIRLLLALMLLMVIATYFWLESRYPDLDNKALMAGAIQLQDPLSFEARYQIDPAWPLWKQIGYTTLNWIFTNRNGMTFGVLFGSVMLALLRYLPRRGFNNGFANSFAGLAIGAPLGVCVNCAAPVAAGMYSGGSRAETSLSAMIASPTFNVIVLSMLISLFPVYMVLIKVGLTLFIVLVVVPAICRLIPSDQLVMSESESGSCIVNPAVGQVTNEETIGSAIYGFGKDFVESFWFIASKTVPLMLLAGLLGATLATLVPFELISSLEAGAFTLILAAVVGVIAPVPMGFDIILAATLLSSGTSMTLVMVLLITLGTYSVYSHIIVSKFIFTRLSLYLAASIVVLSIVGGLLAGAYNDWEIQSGLEELGISSLWESIDFQIENTSNTDIGHNGYANLVSTFRS